MSSVNLCVLKHLGKGSPINAYREEMSMDVEEVLARGMAKPDAWLQVIDAKIANLIAEQARITQDVNEAYSKTAAGKPTTPKVDKPKESSPANGFLPAPEKTTPVAEVSSSPKAVRETDAALVDEAASVPSAEPETPTETANAEPQASQEPSKAADASATDTAPAVVASESAAGTAPATKPSGRIDDFGAKLEGARKDYAATLKDAMDVDVAAEPMSKSWPEPDYQKLLDGGADPFVVAFIHAARDEVPTKPQTSWKVKGWVEGLTSLRETSRAMLSGEIPPDKAQAAAMKAGPAMRTVLGRAELYQLVGHGQSLKGITLQWHHYAMYRGEKDVSKWAIEQKAKATAFSNWPREIAVADTKDEVLAIFKEKIGTLDLGKKAKGQASQFVIYRKRGQTGAWVGKKIGREYIDLHQAADIKEAREYMADNTAALEAKLAKYRETPFERKNENQPRVGDDHRNGAPVTPEVFADTFGFRGVQFGNYVEQDRRQSDLNEAFDGLMDMAAVLGVPPRALSLNGRLGLAFGARGKGGKNAPAAHFEPGSVVINLTKGGGPGSLAHEWWHAVDNYFARQSVEGSTGLVTGGAAVDRLRPELQGAYKSVRIATQAPTLRRRAAELDKRRSKPYWNTTEELSARAFESYVIAKLEDQNAANDYLANVVDEKVWNITESARAEFLGGGEAETYPYPGQAELPAVRAAFDDFFKTVETRTDDAGNVAMFSRSQTADEQNALKALSQNDDLFALPRSDKTTVEGIAADIDPQIKVTKRNMPGEQRYDLTMPDGNNVRLIVRKPNPYGPTLYGYNQVDGELTDKIEKRPGDNPDDVDPGTEDVFIDASLLTPGGAGTRAYQIAATYAHNTGRIFIGDPAGLSDEALRRRSEQMLSSALKFGTTEHLAPHPRQVQGDAKLGVPPLKWVYGDDIGNIRRLVDLNLKALENRFPDIKKVDFDLSRGIFVDAKTGQRIDRSGLVGRVSALRGEGNRALESSAAGGATVARGIVLRALVREEGRAGGADGQGSGLLARLAGLGSDAGEATKGIFYSRTSVEDRRSAERRVEDVTKLAAEITSRWANAPEVVVVDDLSDPRVPESIRAEDTRQQSQGATGSPEGIYYKGKVYLVASELHGDADVVRVLFHEALGHAGLRGTFGKELGTILDRLAALNQGKVRIKAKQYGLDYDKPSDRRAAAEEVLAEMAQTRPEIGWVKRAIAAIRTFLRDHVPGFTRMRMTDAEIVRNFILPARRFVEQGGKAGVSDNVSMSSRSTDQTQTQAFRKWFGDSVLTVDGKPGSKPLVVYHGTLKGGFSTFAKGENGTYGDGIYFAKDPATANFWAGDREAEMPGESEPGGSVYPVYVRITKPANEDIASEVESTHGSDTSRVLQEMGYDGVITSDDEVVAFDPSQIKSAIGNSGQFDPTEPDIRFSRAAPLTEAKFYNAYLQHIDVRGRISGAAAQNAEDIVRNGFKPAGPAAVNVMPAYRGGEPGNVAEKAYAPKVGDTVYLVPRSAVKNDKVLAGWKPQPYEVLQITEDNQALYPAYLESWNQQQAGDAPKFSRTPAEMLRGINQASIRNAFLDATTGHGNVNLWAKTVGTQYDKAQRNPQTFGRVFNAVQDYIKDISSFANAAADQAPSILPKLDTFRDLVRRGASRADLNAVGAVIFQGTLDKELLDRPALLAKGLTEKQADLYGEFRAAVNQSLEDVAKTEIVRLAGDAGAPVANRALAAPTARQAADIMADHLRQQGLPEDADGLYGKVDVVEKLKAEGYAPLMRFGKHTVHIQQDGETLFFSMYESRMEANAMARQLRTDPEFAGLPVEQGVMSQESYKLFNGLSIDSLELFASEVGGQDNPVYQDFLKLTKNNRSALKRLIRRNGTAGFSTNTERVLASFVTSNARLASGNLHLGRAKATANDIPKEMGDLKDEAVKLVEFVQNPTETAQAVRGLLFTTFIGGSVASAMVNMTQPMTMTLPYLSQFGGLAKASARMLAALKIVASGKASGEIGQALKRAEADGIVSPQEIHHLQAATTDSLGNHPYLKKAAFIWGSMFSLAEQFNRRLTFVAAYQTALDNKMADPFAFSEKAVIETQGLYNKGNSANWARNATGATALTFKQFSTHYLEWLTRMYQSGPEGKKAAITALAILLLAGGAGGLPFADDLDDLIDTLAQALGYDFNSKMAKRKFIASVLEPVIGKDGSETAAEIGTRGLTALPGFPMDLSLRMGMGNLLPATGLMLRSNNDRSRDLLEVAGAAGGLAKMVLDGGEKLLQGDPGGAAQSVAPVAIQNVAKAIQMWDTGEYRNQKGAKVSDVDGVDAGMKFLGFQPAEVARESAKVNTTYRTIQLVKNVESDLSGRMAQARVDGDVEAEQAARQELIDWNRKNPQSPIRIRPADIARRARELRASRADRLIKSAPKELRPAVQEALN